MLFVRWIKRKAFMNQELRRYGWYAFGEILLVVAGILIALQIDAWYEDRQEARRLDSFLGGVATDIADDLQRIRELKRRRYEAALDAQLVMFSIGYREEFGQWYNAGFLEKARPALEQSQTQAYFVANSSSYRTLESSGLMNRIADSSLKRHLYDYYRTVERISSIERDLNNTTRDLTMQYETVAGENMGLFYVREPLLLFNDGAEDNPNIDAIRAYHAEILTSATVQALLASSADQTLFGEYEHLLSLGNALVSILDADRPHAAGTGDIFSADSNRGFDVIIEDGLPAFHSAGLFSAPPCESGEYCLAVDIHSVQLADDALRVDYAGGQPWAFFYVLSGPMDINTAQQGRDFSAYDRIRLTLRTHSGCDSLSLVLKDTGDPDDGSEDRVPIPYAEDWQTLTIRLDEFSNADLTRLHELTGFLMFEHACSFSVRDVRFLKPGV